MYELGEPFKLFSNALQACSFFKSNSWADSALQKWLLPTGI